MINIMKLLNQSKKAVVLTGSGISFSSKTSKMEDLFNESYRNIFSSDFYQNNAQEFYKYYVKLINYNEIKPSYIHFGLAKLGIRVITQNIDCLHELAGSKDPIHLHGKINEFKCINCKTIHNLNLNKMDFIQISTITCSKCNGKLRPNVVLFGESIYRFDEAVDEVLKADLLLLLGISLKIWPANNLLNRAQSKNCKIISMNGKYEELFNRQSH